MLAIPVIGDTTGKAMISTVLTTVVEQFKAFITVYPIMLVPPLKPVTNPLVEILATAGVPDVQYPVAVSFVSCILLFTHASVEPAMAATIGATLTVTVTVPDAVLKQVDELASITLSNE